MNCDLFQKHQEKGRETIVRTDYKKQCGGVDWSREDGIYFQSRDLRGKLLQLCNGGGKTVQFIRPDSHAGIRKIDECAGIHGGKADCGTGTVSFLQ